MSHSKTVIDAKAAFLRSQVRLLSAVLQPSAQWRHDNNDLSEPEDGGDGGGEHLSDKVVQDVMVKGIHSKTLPFSKASNYIEGLLVLSTEAHRRLPVLNF